MKNYVLYVKKSFVLIKKSENYKNYCKFRDHCHFTGKYRGAAHSICKLKYIRCLSLYR